MNLNAVTYMQSGIKKKNNKTTNKFQRNRTEKYDKKHHNNHTCGCHSTLENSGRVLDHKFFFLAKRFLNLLNSVFGSFEVVSSSHAEPCRGWMCILSFWPLNLLKPYICLMFLKSQQKAYETQELKA